MSRLLVAWGTLAGGGLVALGAALVLVWPSVMAVLVLVVGLAVLAGAGLVAANLYDAHHQVEVVPVWSDRPTRSVVEHHHHHEMTVVHHHVVEHHHLDSYVTGTSRVELDNRGVPALPPGR